MATDLLVDARPFELAVEASARATGGAVWVGDPPDTRARRPDRTSDIPGRLCGTVGDGKKSQQTLRRGPLAKHSLRAGNAAGSLRGPLER